MLKGFLIILIVAYATAAPYGYQGEQATQVQVDRQVAQEAHAGYGNQAPVAQEAHAGYGNQAPVAQKAYAGYGMQSSGYEYQAPARIVDPGPPAPEPLQLPSPYGPPHVPGPPPLPVPFVRPTLPLLPFYPVNPLPASLPPLYPATSDALLLFDSGYARAQMPLLPTRNIYLTPSFNVPPFNSPFYNPIISGATPQLV